MTGISDCHRNFQLHWRPRLTGKHGVMVKRVLQFLLREAALMYACLIVQAGLKPTKKASSRQSAAAEAEAAEERYEVPADFDAAVLGTPDFSSKGMAEKTMAALFLKRWWDLRSKVTQQHNVMIGIASLLPSLASGNSRTADMSHRTGYESIMHLQHVL